MRDEMAHSGNASTMGFLTGALVGAGLALLLAPASGSETRKRLGDTARRLREDMPEKARHIADRARSALGTIEEGVKHGVNEARSVTREQV